jgi:hypothetical protein
MPDNYEYCVIENQFGILEISSNIDLANLRIG